MGAGLLGGFLDARFFGSLSSWSGSCAKRRLLRLGFPQSEAAPAGQHQIPRARRVTPQELFNLVNDLRALLLILDVGRSEAAFQKSKIDGSVRAVSLKEARALAEERPYLQIVVALSKKPEEAEEDDEDEDEAVDEAVPSAAPGGEEKTQEEKNRPMVSAFCRELQASFASGSLSKGRAGGETIRQVLELEGGFEKFQRVYPFLCTEHARFREGRLFPSVIDFDQLDAPLGLGSGSSGPIPTTGGGSTGIQESGQAETEQEEFGETRAAVAIPEVPKTLTTARNNHGALPLPEAAPLPARREAGRVFLGNFGVASNGCALRLLGVTHVVNCTTDCPFPPGCLPALGAEEEDGDSPIIWAAEDGEVSKGGDWCGGKYLVPAQAKAPGSSSKHADPDHEALLRAEKRLVKARESGFAAAILEAETVIAEERMALDLAREQGGRPFVGFRVPVIDEADQDIQQHFAHAIRFTDAALASGGTVLFHCKHGQSRSPTVLAAWLVSQRRKLGRQYHDVDSALGHLKSCRPKVAPNAGFVAQLRAFAETTRDAKEAEPFVRATS